MTTRTLTRLEAKLLGLTPTQTHIINDVLAGGKVHPQHFRNGGGRHYALLGMGRGRITKILATINISGSDIEYGNDAPRGGAEGKWIKLSASGRAKARRRLAEDVARCYCGRSMPAEVAQGGKVWACQYCSKQCKDAAEEVTRMQYGSIEGSAVCRQMRAGN